MLLALPPPRICELEVAFPWTGFKPPLRWGNWGPNVKWFVCGIKQLISGRGQTTGFWSVWLLCVLVCSSLGSSYLGLCISWACVTVFLFHVREVFSYYLRPFLSLSSPSGTPLMQTLVLLMLSRRSLKLSLFLFTLYSVPWQQFPPLCLPTHWSALLPHSFCCWFLLVYFFSSVTVFFSSVWLFVMSSLC